MSSAIVTEVNGLSTRRRANSAVLKTCKSVWRSETRWSSSGDLCPDETELIFITDMEAIEGAKASATSDVARYGGNQALELKSQHILKELLVPLRLTPACRAKADACLKFCTSDVLSLPIRSSRLMSIKRERN